MRVSTTDSLTPASVNKNGQIREVPKRTPAEWKRGEVRYRYTGRRNVSSRKHSTRRGH